MKKWIRKADEMEMSIIFRALKARWLYMIIFLTVWTMVSAIKTGDLGLPFTLLLTEQFVGLGAEWILKKKMSGDSENDE